MTAKSTFAPVLLLFLLAFACRMLNSEGNNQANSNNSSTSSGSNSYSTGSSRDYEAILPPQVGTFDRTDKPGVLDWCSGTGVDYPTCVFDASAKYKAENGGTVSIGDQRFKSPQDAKHAMDLELKEDTDTSGTHTPGYDINADTARSKITKRTPTKNGGELVILETLPGYRKIRIAFWVNGSDLFAFGGTDEARNLEPVEALANAYIQR